MKSHFWILLVLVSLTSHAEESSVLGCYAIDDAEDRLACYDTISRRILVQAKVDQKAEPDNPDAVGQTLPAPAVPVAGPEPATAPIAAPAASPAEDMVTVPAPPSAEDFGRNPADVVQSVDQITSTITKVTKSIRNNRIVELANGQIWMENEPGKQRIKVDQQVTITKRRWRYTMKLPEGPIIAVHRVN